MGDAIDIVAIESRACFSVEYVGREVGFVLLLVTDAGTLKAWSTRTSKNKSGRGIRQGFAFDEFALDSHRPFDL